MQISPNDLSSAFETRDLQVGKRSPKHSYDDAMVRLGSSNFVLVLIASF